MSPKIYLKLQPTNSKVNRRRKFKHRQMSCLSTFEHPNMFRLLVNQSLHFSHSIKGLVFHFLTTKNKPCIWFLGRTATQHSRHPFYDKINRGADYSQSPFPAYGICRGGVMRIPFSFSEYTIKLIISLSELTIQVRNKICIVSLEQS